MLQQPSAERLAGRHLDPGGLERRSVRRRLRPVLRHVLAEGRLRAERHPGPRRRLSVDGAMDDVTARDATSVL